MAKRRGRRRASERLNEESRSPSARRADFTFIPTFKPEKIREFAELMKRNYGKEMTEYEAEEALGNLVRYFLLLDKMDREQKKRAAESAPAIEPDKNEPGTRKPSAEEDISV